MDLWNTETAIEDIPGLDLNLPIWIDQNITPSDVAAIVQGGCASGAYMPAVTYHKALAVMSEDGDEVLQFIEDQLGELPQPKRGESWSGLACFYLSTAVELWASSVESELEQFELETEEA